MSLIHHLRPSQGLKEVQMKFPLEGPAQHVENAKYCKYSRSKPAIYPKHAARRNVDAVRLKMADPPVAKGSGICKRYGSRPRRENPRVHKQSEKAW